MYGTLKGISECSITLLRRGLVGIISQRYNEERSGTKIHTPEGGRRIESHSYQVFKQKTKTRFSVKYFVHRFGSSPLARSLPRPVSS